MPSPDASPPPLSAPHGDLATQLLTTLAPIAVASFLLNVFALCTPLITMVIYNKVLPHQAYSTLHLIVIIAVTVYLFDMLLRIARAHIATYTGARMTAALSNHTLGRLLRQPLRYFECTPAAELGEKLRQLDSIRTFLTGQMPMLLTDLAFTALLLAALYFIDWRMGLIATATLPVFILITLLSDQAMKAHNEAAFRAGANRTSMINALLGSTLTIKALRLEHTLEARHCDLLATSTANDFNTQQLASLTTTASAFLYGLVTLGVIYLGAHLIMDDKMSMGALIATNMLFARILSPVRQISAAWYGLRSARSAYDRLKPLFAADFDAQSDTTTLPPPKGHLSVDNMTFEYSPDHKPTLRDISFACAPGTITGIIGATGCGKSTLGKLLVGVYHPSQGRVLIDGYDIALFGKQGPIGSTAYMPQDLQLFPGTIAENILIGIPTATPARAVQAAQLAGAHAFIQCLPMGYNHILTDNGAGLSGGQRQLLCLARALAREPKILILDEPTSALDPASEQHILQRLRSLTQTAALTIVMITHRTVAARACDSILLLEDGSIATHGPAQTVLPLLNRSAGKA